MQLTIYLLEHLPDSLNVVMIQEPSFAILLILFKWYGERVRHVHDLAVVLTQQDAYGSLR